MIYTNDFRFVLGENDSPGEEFPKDSSLEFVKAVLKQGVTFHMVTRPLTKHPYVKGKVLHSTPVCSMRKAKDGSFWDVETFSGSKYRLITTQDSE